MKTKLLSRTRKAQSVERFGWVVDHEDLDQPFRYGLNRSPDGRGWIREGGEQVIRPNDVFDTQLAALERAFQIVDYKIGALQAIRHTLMVKRSIERGDDVAKRG
jgi:hypothetical protein